VSAPFTNFDFLQVACNPAVNYLHTGKALDVLSEFLRKDDESRWPNNVVLRQLGLHLAGSSELTRLIRGYLGSHKRMKFAELQKELQESLKWRNRFRALGCRGFSYVMDFQMKGYNNQQPCQFRLAPFVNLRLALMPGKHLFYPIRVKQYFRQVIWPDNHYFQKKIPSIAICFGKKTENAWYVFVMQSDLASKGLSCVREHFRGWRNILFANVVAQARGKVPTLYLCRARDVERACYPRNEGSWMCTWAVGKHL